MEVDIVLNAEDKAQIDAMIKSITKVLSFAGISEFLETRAQPYLAQRARLRFANEGDDASGKWRPLSEVTERWREWCAAKYGLAITGPTPINVRTGALYRWVTETYAVKPFGSAAKDNTVELTLPGKISDPWLAVKLRHAQQGGFTRYFSGFGPRPVAVVSTVDSVQLTRMAGTWFDEMFAKLAA
jgi:hypothetical protein